MVAADAKIRNPDEKLKPEGIKGIGDQLQRGGPTTQPGKAPPV